MKTGIAGANLTPSNFLPGHGIAVTHFEFTDTQRAALPDASPDFAIRLKRFRRFDDAAFGIMKRAILLGEITDPVIARVERDVVAALRAMPETLAEMLLYTRTINVGIYGKTHRRGWPWARYTCHKFLHMDCTFDPYRSGVSAWTDKTAPDGVVRFQ